MDVRAAVALPIRVWDLLLDASDTRSGGVNSWAGYQKAQAIEDIYETGDTVELKDGYDYR